MNLVDCYVTKVIGVSFDKETGLYKIEVEYDSYGVIGKGFLFRYPLSEVLKVKAGFKFLQ